MSTGDAVGTVDNDGCDIVGDVDGVGGDIGRVDGD